MSRIARVVALVAVLAAVPAVALAAGPTKHKLSTSVTGAIVKTVGSTAYSAGITSDPSLGAGATSLKVAGGSAISGTIFTKKGSMTGSGKLSFGSAGADGSTPYTGTLTVKSGTGAFKGAAGKLVISGTQKGDAFTAKLKGSVTY